jgi:hypothetical protein
MWKSRERVAFLMKLTILEMYDQMKEAMESGTEYQTWLDPPPADERLAHADNDN